MAVSTLIETIAYVPVDPGNLGFLAGNTWDFSIIESPIPSVTFKYPSELIGTDRGIYNYKIESFTDILYGSVYVFPTSIAAGLILEEKVYYVEVWNTLEGENLYNVIKLGFDGISLQEPESPPFPMSYLANYTYIVTISTIGPAIVNATLRYETTNQIIEVPITGTRAIWIPYRPQVSSAAEIIENKTDVITSYNGKEQRIRTLINPHQKLTYSYKLFGDEITSMQLLLGGWYSRSFLSPNWLEAVKYDSGLTLGTTTIMLDTTNSDFRVGESVLIWESNENNIVSIISEVQPTYITLQEPVPKNYYKPQLVPTYTSFIEGNTSRSVHPSPYLTEYSLTFRTENPKYIGDKSFYPEEFKGFPVILDSPYTLPASDSINEESELIDYSTGPIIQFEKWNRSRHNRSWNKRLHQTEYFSFKKWIHWMRGTQQMLFMPSSEKDFVVISDIAPGEFEIIINKISWSSFYDKIPYQYICIKDSRDGKLLMSGVDKVIDNANGTETIQLRDALQPLSTLPSSDIEFSQFMFLMRFSSDKQTIKLGSGGIYTFNQELIGVDYEL